MWVFECVRGNTGSQSEEGKTGRTQRQRISKWQKEGRIGQRMIHQDTSPWNKSFCPHLCDYFPPKSSQKLHMKLHQIHLSDVWDEGTRWKEARNEDMNETGQTGEGWDWEGLRRAYGEKGGGGVYVTQRRGGGGGGVIFESRSRVDSKRLTLLAVA